MRALSLKQPYAELIVSGRKTIELRKWKTNFRGEFLVHASKQVDKKAMAHFGFNELPTGCIIGKAFLKDIKKYSSAEEHLADKAKHLASADWGTYGFVLGKALRLNKPIPAKGALSFWEYPGKA